MISPLPPSEKRKQYELRALGLRDFAGVEADQPLDPFALAHFAKLMVVDFDQIEGLSDESRRHLLGEAADEWSGGACSRPLPNGWKIVILNPAHGIHRNRATLMEEISHVFLGHQANRLAVVDSGPAPKNKEKKKSSSAAVSPNPLAEGEGPKQKILARDYNKADEEAAYAVGAAALVPFAALRRAVLAGRTADQIAHRFGVSRQLVEYRIKVTHLWGEYKDASNPRTQHV
jgi:IrrE N-terminal-like domain